MATIANSYGNDTSGWFLYRQQLQTIVLRLRVTMTYLIK